MRKPFIAGFVGIVGLVACSSADPYGDLPPRPTVEKSATQSCDPGASAAAMPSGDPAKFKECKGTKGGKGRCIPGTVLGSFKGTFEQSSCAGGEECVPDELVKDASNVKLKKCTGILNSEGRCFWPLAKDIVASYDLLKGASKDCDGDMVCAPCADPRTGEDTKVCSIGADTACGAKSGDTKKAGPAGGTCPQLEPIIDTKAWSEDSCGSGMLCVEASLVGDQAKMLKDCSKGKCAPKKSVERAGNYVPKTCRSLANAEGRCLNVGIPQIAEQASLLPKEGCDADETCAPCFDPRTGADTGACRSAPCDAPKEPKKTLAKCCGGRGQCVPASAAGESADMLAKDTCTADAPLCAPNELSGSVPPQKCTALLFLEGICVSKCTLDTFVKDFVQGSCPEGDMCAPCSFLPDGSCK